MSYILDALKKADQERTIGEVPDLDAPHWGERHTGRSYRSLWGIVVLLAINGLLLVVLVGRDADTETASEAVRPDTAASLPVEPQPRVRSKAVEPPRLPVRPRVTAPVQPPPVARPGIPESRVSAPVVPAVTKPAPTQAQGVASDVPDWDELPLEFRSRFTLPHLDVHVYADEKRRRFIMVDLQKYREGDTLESGAVLEEIQPGSIQLYYEGTRFRMEK